MVQLLKAESDDKKMTKEPVLCQVSGLPYCAERCYYIHMTSNNAFTIELAGRRIRVEALYDSVRELCKDYIVGENVAKATSLSADCPDETAPDFVITITQEDIERERVYSAEQDAREGRASSNWGDAYLETLAVYRKIATKMLDYDTLLMHGSAIEVNGRAVIFTGPSGTGKSTHAKLWIDHVPGTSYINDDKPLVSIGSGGGVSDTADRSRALGTAAAEPRAHGTPWDGKHRRSSNKSAPIAAICMLHQSSENYVEELSAEDAFPLLLQRTYTPEEPALMIKTLRVFNAIVKSGVRFLDVHCNMEPDAVAYWVEAL